MPLYEFESLAPKVAPSAWIADSAQVIGAVTIEDDSSIWFGSVLKGSLAGIYIGARSNVQDGSLLATESNQPLRLGDQVTIGHLAKLCSCEIQDQTLVGIGATINAGARIGRNCLVGAGTVVEAGQEFSDGWLIFGNPGKAVRLLTVDQIEGVRLNAERYVENARRFRLGLKQVLPGN